MLNASQKRTKRPPLDSRLYVQASRQHHGLVGHNTHRMTVHAGETNDDVLRMLGLQLPELAVIRHLVDQLLHVVRQIGVIRNQGVERHLHTVGAVGGGPVWGFFAVIGRQIVDEPPHHQQRFHIVLVSAIADAGDGGMGHGAAQFFRCHLFVGHRLDHIGTGDKHVRAVFHHKDEVGYGRRVDGAPGARPHDDGDLRHHAGGHHITLEYLGVAAQGSHSLLDAGATRVVKADDRVRPPSWLDP